MTEPILPPLKPIPIKDRVSVLFLEKGNVDILDGAFVVVGKKWNSKVSRDEADGTDEGAGQVKAQEAQVEAHDGAHEPMSDMEM